MIATRQYEIDVTLALDGAFVASTGARLGDTTAKKR
jgi:hypothetical protein